MAGVSPQGWETRGFTVWPAPVEPNATVLNDRPYAVGRYEAKVDPHCEVWFEGRLKSIDHPEQPILWRRWPESGWYGGGGTRVETLNMTSLGGRYKAWMREVERYVPLGYWTDWDTSSDTREVNPPPDRGG